MSEQRFKSTVSKSGNKTILPLPFDPNEVWGTKDRHYVAGTINEYKIRALLEFDGAQYKISLGEAWLRDNRIDQDAEVEIVLAPEGPQSTNLAPDIVAALASESEASAFFDSLPTFYRKNYIRWIEQAKRPETRANRIAETVRLLKAKQRER